MAIIMCSVWTILFFLTILAFWKGKIFYAKDEDVMQDMVNAVLIDEPAVNEKGKSPEYERDSGETERTFYHSSSQGHNHV